MSSNSKQTYPFQEKQQSILFNKLIHEFRCSVCQNQSLAESDALLAVTLRNEIYRQVRSLQTEPQIIAFMAERYGEFVLYEPPFHAGTALLWWGPWMFVLMGLFVFLKLVRKKPTQC